jgi:CheY-like chemotaxis protein
MPRVVLVHWKPQEAEPLAEALRAAGHDASVLAPGSSKDLRTLDASPPDAVIIDLSRLPSQGRAVAIDIRRRKATRMTPIIFAGDAEKLERAREILPDAEFADWAAIGAAIRRALKPRKAPPTVPDTMAGYSGTPLPKKLGIKAGARVALVNAPKDFAAALSPLPESARTTTSLRTAANLILLFVKSQKQLEGKFASTVKGLEMKGSIWIVWPKKSSGVVSDVTETFVRAYGLARGFVDYKVCAVDSTWSGLCFTRRKAEP